MKGVLKVAKGVLGKPADALVGKTVQVGNYTVLVEAKLGEGGFASIYRVLNRGDQQRFALKHFRIQGDLQRYESVKQEALLMKKLKADPNVVTLYAASFGGPDQSPNDGFFLMQLCTGNLVETLEERHATMTERDILVIMLQVAKGVRYMHSLPEPIAHRDLKAENILQSTDGNWLVCDFGSASTTHKVFKAPAEIALETDNVMRNTTSAYRAPELYDLYSGQLVNTKVDIWALGVLLYLMCFRKFPYPPEAKLQVLSGQYDMPPSKHREETRSLVRSMLHNRASQRPDIDQVIRTVRAVIDGGRASPHLQNGALLPPQAQAPLAAAAQWQQQTSNQLVTPRTPNGLMPPPATPSSAARAQYPPPQSAYQPPPSPMYPGQHQAPPPHINNPQYPQMPGPPYHSAQQAQQPFPVPTPQSFGSLAAFTPPPHVATAPSPYQPAAQPQQNASMGAAPRQPTSGTYPTTAAPLQAMQPPQQQQQQPQQQQAFDPFAPSLSATSTGTVAMQGQPHGGTGSSVCSPHHPGSARGDVAADPFSTFEPARTAPTAAPPVQDPFEESSAFSPRVETPANGLAPPVRAAPQPPTPFSNQQQQQQAQRGSLATNTHPGPQGRGAGVYGPARPASAASCASDRPAHLRGEGAAPMTGGSTASQDGARPQGQRDTRGASAPGGQQSSVASQLSGHSARTDEVLGAFQRADGSGVVPGLDSTSDADKDRLIAQLQQRIQRLGADKDRLKSELALVCGSRDRYAQRAAELQRVNAALELKLRRPGARGVGRTAPGASGGAEVPDLTVPPSACPLAKRVVGSLNASKHAAALMPPRMRRSLSDVHVAWDELGAAD